VKSLSARCRRPARTEGEVVFPVADVDVTRSPSSGAPTSAIGTAVAHDAAGGVGGAQEGGLIKLPPKIELEVQEDL
jgi:hypothetical protein